MDHGTWKQQQILKKKQRNSQAHLEMCASSILPQGRIARLKEAVAAARFARTEVAGPTFLQEAVEVMQSQQRTAQRTRGPCHQRELSPALLEGLGSRAAHVIGLEKPTVVSANLVDMPVEVLETCPAASGATGNAPEVDE